jgi:hypothetical protein
MELQLTVTAYQCLRLQIVTLNEKEENLKSQFVTSSLGIKGNALSSNSVGHRPTYETASLSLRPEGAIAKGCDMAHALTGLRLLRFASFRRAMPYANAQRALPLAGFNFPEFEGIRKSNYGEFAIIKNACRCNRPRSGQRFVTVGKSARRAVRNPRRGNVPIVQHPVGVQLVDCCRADCTPPGYGWWDGYLQPGAYTPGYQDMTAMRSSGNNNIINNN